MSNERPQLRAATIMPAALDTDATTMPAHARTTTRLADYAPRHT